MSGQISYTKKMGPGIPWQPWATGLIEACRAAGLHVVANTIQTGMVPVFRNAEVSEVRAEVTKLQTELKTLASRIHRLASADAVPWTEAEINLKYQEHIDYLDLFFATALHVMVDTDKEELNALIAEYHLSKLFP
jgi:uncharacterized protein YlxW (UPF0749 family)